MIWRVGAIGTAALVALPLLGLAASLLDWRGEMWRHLAETQLRDIVANTALLLLGVGVGTTVIGTGTAWLVTMHRFPFSRTLEWGLILPMVLPTYIIGYAYADLLAYAGLLQSALRAVTGWQRDDYWFPEPASALGVAALFTLVLYPYVYLAARAAFLSQSQPLLEASRILGRGPWRTFFAVGLPLARPAIAAGAALALFEALADFGTVQYYGVPTFTTAIYRIWFGMGDRDGAAQVAVVLLVIAVLLILLERRSRGRARFHVASNLRENAGPSDLAGGRAAVSAVACALPVLLGFAVPAAHLFQLAVRSGMPVTWPAFLRDAMHSLMLATARRGHRQSRLVPRLRRPSRSPAPLQPHDRVRHARIRHSRRRDCRRYPLPLDRRRPPARPCSDDLFGLSIGLVLSGTPVALLLAYTVRFLAVGIANIAPGWLRSIRRWMPVRRSSAPTILRRIHLPMLRGPAITAAIVAFVEVLKELPATLLLPFNFDTLAVGVYRFASDERLGEAAVGALVIVATSLIPVILLSRAIALTTTSRRRDP